jgi:hypothetical protein
MTWRLFKGIFREVEAFDYKCEAFLKITRHFQKNGGFSKKSEAFSKILKTFSMKLWVF